MRHPIPVLSYLFVTAAMGAAPPAVRSFDGDSGPGLAVCETGVTHCGWPDMNAAVNGQQVVQVTWQHVRVYDYHGGLLRSTPMATFIREAGLDPLPVQRRKPQGPSAPGPYETEVVYDEFIHRWLITVTGHSDSLLVSASGNAMGSWRGVNLSCLDGGPCLDFDPALHMGYDRNGVYYCGTHAGDSNPNTIPGYAYDCMAVPSTEIAAIPNGKIPGHVNRVHNMPLDVFPAIDHNRGKRADAPAFFVARTCERSTAGGCQNAKNYPFRWIVETFTWKGATGTYNSGGEQVVKTGIGSKRKQWLYNKPCCGQWGTVAQAGNDTIQLRVVESHRLSNLVQYGSHLYGVLTSGPCTSDCGEQGTDTNNVAFWVDLDCWKTDACVVSQTAKLSGAFNPAFATVGVDAEGNVGIVAASALAGSDLSILLWTRRKSDPANTFHGPIIVASGTQPYTCLNERNYASIGNPAGVLTALDPQDGTSLWTTQQWANNAARCVWNTRIVEYRIAPPGADQKSKPKH